MSTVLVTGGSGFVASHCILQLLAQGHQVRTTVRNLSRETEVRKTLASAGADAGEQLTFFQAELLKDDGWPAAVEGCDYVLHVASPLPSSAPKHENDLIIPARDGAVRVLRASRDAGVKRVVLTSSFAAIGYGHPTRTEAFTEKDWTDVQGSPMSAYVKSKTFAERAAWDFIAKEGGLLELSVINPVAIFGPVLGPDYASSILIIQKLMDGAIPACPRLVFGCVDVRDVADLHLRAMTHPTARGERFLGLAGSFLSIQDVAKVLKSRLGEFARRVPSWQAPDWLIRLVGLFDSNVREITYELGKIKSASNQKAREMLGWSPRSNEESIVACAESMVRLGLLRDSAKRVS